MSGSTLVALGILFSRIFGLARSFVVAGFFGTGLGADILAWATRFPNVLQNLLGEGTLSASFIPVYAELVERGRREESGRVAGAVFALLFTAAAGLAGLGILLAPAAVSVFLPAYVGEDRALAIAAARIVFPTTGILVLSAWALGIQNAHRAFLLSYLAPVASSVAVIAAIAVAGGALGWSGSSLLLAAAWGTFAGGVLQLAVQIPAVLRLEPDLKIRFDTSLQGVRDTLRNAVPAIGGRGVVQLSSWLDLWLAGLLATGAIASLSYAQILYLLPLSLFGMSIVAAELPELARQREDATGALREKTNAAIERVLFYIVPSSAAFLAIGPAIAGILERGAFTADDTALVSWVLRAYALGLVATTVTRVTASAFYALRDTRAPARVATLRVVVSGAVGFALMVQLEPVGPFESGALADLAIGERRLGAVGIAAGTAVAAWVEWAVLQRALAARIGTVGPRATFVAAVALAAAAASGAGMGVSSALAGADPTLHAVLACAAFGAVYLAIAAALGLSEVTTLLRRARARFRGR